MKRRGSSRKPAKALHATKPRRSRAAKTGRRPSSSIADLQHKIERQARELSEVRERENATAEVLRVISSSAGDLEPVFQSMLANAVRICEARFGTLLRFDGKCFTMPRNLACRRNCSNLKCGAVHFYRRQAASLIASCGRSR